MQSLQPGPALAEQVHPRAGRWEWLSPLRCRLILAGLLLFSFFSSLFYLVHNCPIDLSGDEAQYWDWSRRLDLCYYSKGPLVALIIRASCAIFGNTMPAVRLPALLLGTGTAIVCYLLTRRLFGSDRLALGAVLLNGAVPMFIAGGMLMTIDAPMFFFWALATYFAAIALFDPGERKWPWIAMGFSIGLAALAKYGALLWLPCVGSFLLIDPASRRWLRSPWPWVSAAIALLCLTPCVIWNARHGWVSILHIAASTGAATHDKFSIRLQPYPIEFLLSQVAVLGPTIAVLMIAAVWFALRKVNVDEPATRRVRFLAWLGLLFFAINLLDSFFAKTQVNWPAPAYFTLIILTAWFISTRRSSPKSWRRWRGWVYATVLIGAISYPLIRSDTLLLALLKPVANTVNLARNKAVMNVGNLDPLERVRGWRQLGDAITRERANMAPDCFILCDDYQQTAEAAFYTAGQPITFCAGPYFGKRLSQYDIWPDRRLHDNPSLLGRDAIYVGKGGGLPEEVKAAFSRYEAVRPIPVIVAGVEIKSFKLWRCYNFRGFAPLVAQDH